MNAEVTAEAPFKNYAIYHWDRYGRREQRKHRWESGNEKWIGYLDRYPDLRQNGITTKEQAIQHYLRKGKVEGRNICVDNNPVSLMMMILIRNGERQE